MSDQPSHPPSDPARKAQAAAERAELRIAHAEERRAMFREIAELAMDLTRDAARRALARPDTTETAAEAPAAETSPARTPRLSIRHDPADDFVRFSRAARVSLVLEAHAEAELAALHDPAPVSAANAAPSATPKPPPPAPEVDPNASIWPDLMPRDYPSAAKNKVRDGVYGVMNREVNELIPAQEMLDTIYERFAEGERYDQMLYRPVKEVVTAICEDLGLVPNWTEWTGDGWPEPVMGKPYRAWDMCWAPDHPPLKNRADTRERDIAESGALSARLE